MNETRNRAKLAGLGVALLALAAGLVAQAGKTYEAGLGAALERELTRARSPTAAPPQDLRATGLYADGAGKIVRREAVEVPAAADRPAIRSWVQLPPATAVDTSVPGRWVFPVGTRLWKEAASDGRLQTRYAERRADGWRVGTYIWNDDETEAVLAPSRPRLVFASGSSNELELETPKKEIK